MAAMGRAVALHRQTAICGRGCAATGIRNRHGAERTRPDIRCPSMSANMVAICSGGGVGDLLAATPAIRALQRHFGAPLSVLTSAYAAPILQDQPSVRDVMIDDGAKPERGLASRLREREFTHAVVFWSTARVAGAARRAGIPVRVGQARRLYSR